MAASLLAVAFNLSLKVLLYKPFGVAGLATATAVGYWINLLLLCSIGWLQNVMRPDDTLVRVAIAVDAAALALGIYVFLANGRIADATASLHFGDVIHLGLTGASGAAVYGAALAIALRVGGVRVPLRRGARA